jgi:transcriptional regulator with XRE-family HTH domain
MGEHRPDFAARLRQVMAEINVSRITLARELGLDKSVIGRWLGGVNQPTDHNLTRLTNVVRRYRPEVTLEFWDHAPLRGPPAPAQPASTGLMITGLHAERQPRIDANYLGLWGGFYQSTQNRGSVVMAVMHIENSPNGLRSVFTEGKVSASGAAVAIGPRLHVILEIEPLHDRLCLFVFNGVLTPDAIGMDGTYMISAGDTSTCATASPIVLFRIGDTEDYARIGGLSGVMQSLYPVNARNIQDSIQAASPIAGLSARIPEHVLRAVCVQVGVPRADGEFDHVMRIPASRSLPQSYFGLSELAANSPLIITRNCFRRILGLEARSLEERARVEAE